MKTLSLILTSTSLFIVTACSTWTKNNEQAKDLPMNGPSVVDVKTFPGTFDLNQDLQPISRSEIVASVKDFNNKVTGVKLTFVHIRMSVPMKQVSGSTWTADLSAKDLKTLAVNGHTMKYEANIVARDNVGQTAVSSTPIEIAVRAPDINATG